VLKGEYTPLAIDGTGFRNLVNTVTTVMTDAVDKATIDLATAQQTFDAIAAPSDADRKTLADAKQVLADAEKVVSDTQAKDELHPLNKPARIENIEETVKILDKAIGLINSGRADLGAKQNRMTSAIENLQNMTKNATASRGQIEDVDFAAETAELTKQQTLQQASTAILAQANQLPAAVLKLLQ
jgi:flagellin